MAFSMPTRRGRRWVPPAPGMRPSLISGRPSRVPGAAMRKWQASVISSPPPSGVPNIAATTGFSIVFDLPVHIDQARALRRLVELGDVGAGNESAPGAGQHDAGNVLVGVRTCEGVAQAEPDLVLQCVDGRIVDDDDGNVAVAVHGNRGGHAAFPVACSAVRNIILQFLTSMLGSGAIPVKRPDSKGRGGNGGGQLESGTSSDSTTALRITIANSSSRLRAGSKCCARSRPAKGCSAIRKSRRAPASPKRPSAA